MCCQHRPAEMAESGGSGRRALPDGVPSGCEFLEMPLDGGARLFFEDLSFADDRAEPLQTTVLIAAVVGATQETTRDARGS